MPGYTRAHNIARTSVQSAEATRGILLWKSFEFLSFPGRFWGYFSPYCLLESVALWPFFGEVSLLLTANSHTLSDGSIQDLIILKIQIATLRSLISTPLRIFSTWFMIYNSTFGSDDFPACLHWQGTVSSCYRMCPSLGTPLCSTKDFKLAYAYYGKHIAGHS